MSEHAAVYAKEQEANERGNYFSVYMFGPFAGLFGVRIAAAREILGCYHDIQRNITNCGLSGIANHAGKTDGAIFAQGL